MPPPRSGAGCSTGSGKVSSANGNVAAWQEASVGSESSGLKLAEVRVNVGDVGVASELLQHDLDASPIFPKYEVPLMGRARFPADAAIADALSVVAAEVLRDPVALIGEQALDEFGIEAPKVHRGLLVSGDRFVSTTAESEALRRDLPDALAVEMEGAAMAQVCHDYGVPFAAMRTISDRADDAAHGDFARFVVEVASRYSLALVGAWLATLPPSGEAPAAA